MQVTVTGWFKQHEAKPSKEASKKSSALLPDSYMKSVRRFNTGDLQGIDTTKYIFEGSVLPTKLCGVVDLNGSLDPFYVTEEVYATLAPLLSQDCHFK